ncbi:MAG: hypothetical protein K1X75_09940 [Leptospirales bacterium]|nr:hypothetical protein [Leptospirales bacterium]
MARARSKESRESGRDLLDDIELLNVHRYPESMPPAIVAHVRNSRACQRRLEELLKGLPGRRREAANWNPLERQQTPVVEQSSDANSAAPASPPEGGGVGQMLRKLFS